MRDVIGMLTRKSTLKSILHEMSLSQISKLMSDINDIYDEMFNEISALEIAEQEKERKIIQLKAMIVEAGIDISELIGNGVTKRKPVKSKYRLVDHITGRSFEWTGRGRSPLWMVEYETKGGCRDDLLI